MTIKELVGNNRPTVLFIFFFLFSIICLTSQSTTGYLLTVRSFLIYFFSYTYIPMYKIVSFPLNVVNKFIAIPYLFDENIKLKEVVKNLYVDNLRYQNIISKIGTLTAEEIQGNFKYKLLNAEIILRDYKEWYNECISLINNIEEIKYVQEDSPVIYYAGEDKFFLVGRVWTIKNNTIKVLLITNPLSMIPVKVKGKQIHGVIIGNNSPVLTMEYILLEDDIRIGDLIVTSGINNIPEGLTIGQVIDIELSQTGFKKARVKLSFNINALKNLLVLVYPNQVTVNK